MAKKRPRIIQPFAPRDEFLLWCRVSGAWQAHRDNLWDQFDNLSHQIEEFDGDVVGHRFLTGSGFEISNEFLELVAIAKETGATILAETVCRFIRHPEYHSQQRPNLQAGNAEIKQLLDAADGAEIMVHLHPDSTPHQTRVYQRMRGREAKGNRGGRPCKEVVTSTRPCTYLKRYDEDSIARVLRLTENGFSLREIAERLGRPKSTIQGWLAVGNVDRTNLPK